MTRCKKEHQLLRAEDLKPFEVLPGAESENPVLIVCDHASNYVPVALDGLGIDDEHFHKHIGYDIGAAGVSRQIALQLNATAVLSRFSRLVIDPNRYLSAHDSIPTISDGVVIHGNESLSPLERMVRVEELCIPYHNAVNAAVTRILDHFYMPLVLSVHSYTPIFQGFERPWEIGVLWEEDDGVASLLIEYLREHTDFHVGENEPYHACNPVGYTVKTHAASRHYPSALVEIRQDLISDETGPRAFAELLSGALASIRQSLAGVISVRG